MGLVLGEVLTATRPTDRPDNAPLIGR